MKIYTKTGDSGETGLVGGKRVRKNSLRVIAYGAIDELNAALGMARVELDRADLTKATSSDQLKALDQLLARLQHQLFNVGTELASDASAEIRDEWIDSNTVAELESQIDVHTETIPPLRQFILPGGSPPAAQLHVARSACRRAERDIITLAESEPIRPELICYVNRLSDLLFVVARAANQAVGVADVVWEK